MSRYQCGEAHPLWKGGRFLSTNGYIQVSCGGFVKREHILVAEKALGKPLPEGAVVHHINGDKTDNRPQNLVICQDAGYHDTIHKRKRAYEATGNANKWRCCTCGEWFSEDNFYKFNGLVRAHCKPCARKDSKERRKHRDNKLHNLKARQRYWAKKGMTLPEGDNE